MNSKELERKSSAITLSDMEIFIFPELMYSLVLANIMSPRIWLWRDDPWFANLEKMKPYRRILRLKQYIIDHYSFNLDLDTWGLTTREKELERFKNFISEETLAQSNALFGYEGDKYYFDIDIRTHFGLDKYRSNVIPYWKTETVEAMDAFRFKPNYAAGAGECVSLAALYASALFVIARIPLKDIYLMATPLHSQNFIDINGGIITNNRRLVTRNMWFNGTELSAQARRALENERVTIVAHESGFVHTVYDKATIDRQAYIHFTHQLKNFLKVGLSDEILGNFLRNVSKFQKCFQVRWPLHGINNYIPAERIFAYEHGSPYRLTDKTREKLMSEVDSEEFQPTPIPDRLVLNDIEDFIRENKIDLDNDEDTARLKKQFFSGCLKGEEVILSLLDFCHVKPRIPDTESKQFNSDQDPLAIDLDMSREEIVERLERIRKNNIMADMAFYACRDLTRTEPEPFLMAAVRRNPVSVEATRDMDENSILKALKEMPDESIYDGTGRLAQPDEVWNYGRGDGLEKAILLANILTNSETSPRQTAGHPRQRMAESTAAIDAIHPRAKARGFLAKVGKPEKEIHIEIHSRQAKLVSGKKEHAFPTSKGIADQVWILPCIS